MKQRIRFTRYVRHGALAIVACAAAANGQPRAIDAAKSTMTVHVYKAGMFSALGHDHEISAPVAAGTVDVTGRHVELQVNTAALKVQDPKGSDKDRSEIQANMLGPDVLDAESHKEIRFRSTGAEPAGEGAWKLSGELTLHGATHAVTMDVHEHDGHYAGNCRFNITDFGIKPIKAAGGTVRVKDEVQLDFDIQLAH
jgi:polyisoprenoid-binding protein YceI